MIPLIISHSDMLGGAARAAFRLHRAIHAAGISSEMRVLKKMGNDAWVYGSSSNVSKVLGIARVPLSNSVMCLQNSSNPVLHSANVLPGGLTRPVLDSNADVLNIHWVNFEALSIRAIGLLNAQKPMVWTLHDMWAFCGAEHYCDDVRAARFKMGYLSGNRPSGHKRLDIDRWVWLRKRKYWCRPMHIICPSRWLANCARESKLMAGWPIETIPNVLDTNCFQPLDKAFSRQALGLPVDTPIVAFGAIEGGDVRKGFGLLTAALARLGSEGWQGLGVVFGQSEPKEPPRLDVPFQFLGHLHDDTTLALLYNAADVVVVPSRQENLPQIATEAHACGCPVVAFNCTGLPDVVDHRVTGYLATPYNSDDLAIGIRWVLEDSYRLKQLGSAARKRALSLWAPEVIVPQYLEAYRQTIAMFALRQYSK